MKSTCVFTIEGFSTSPESWGPPRDFRTAFLEWWAERSQGASNPSGAQPIRTQMAEAEYFANLPTVWIFGLGLASARQTGKSGPGICHARGLKGRHFAQDSQ